MLAKPAAKHYWTLSVWDSEESLGAFVQARPHPDLMASLRPKMGRTKFAQRAITSADGLPTLVTAMERLGQP
ncbi:MAG TPA: hypothetical protein VKU86_12755 [Acidimicrobiales bacterium]|nr:hypothetical protein [Acidimicrobiales bacterium]